MTVIVVSDDSFEREVLNSAEPVVVDFFAEWCGPCKAMAPALDEAAAELAGKVKIVKVDVDKSPATKDKYAIRAMPTLLVLKSGTVVSRRVGGIPQKAKLLEWIASASAASDAPPEPRAEEFKLTNGLHVVVIPSPRATSVTVRTIYKAGAADDIAGANLLWALLPQLPDKAKPAFAQILPDYTVFPQVVSKDELQAAMQRDVARMAPLNVTEEDVAEAKQKLIESFSRSNSEGQLGQQMSAALFGSHPYAMRRSGAADKVVKLSREDLARLHRRYCAPNNAVVIISGAVTAEEAKRLAEEAYGQIAANPDVGTRARPEFTLIEAGQRFTATEPRAKKGMLSRRYAVPSNATASAGEAEALEILALVLSAPGRLTRPPASEGRPDVIARGQYSGANLGTGELLFRSPDRDPETTEAEFDQVIADVRTNGVTEAELAGAKERLAADHVSANYDEKSISARYDAVAIGIPISRIEGRLDAIAKVTAEDIKRVANAYLDPRRAVTGWLLPEAATAEDSAPLAKAG
jgi:zinc protease